VAEELNREGLAELAARAGEGTPVVMLNLLAFDGDAGRESYARYAEAVGPLLAGVGGEVLYAGQAAIPAIGENSWDLVLLVRYPSRQAFLDMVGSPEYAEISHLRSEALTRSELHPLDQLEDGALA
jgi:uncharacterized protein (DUF1330 family)